MILGVVIARGSGEPVSREVGGTNTEVIQAQKESGSPDNTRSDVGVETPATVPSPVGGGTTTNPEAVGGRVIAVKVGNSPGEQPQVGLQEADIVYETPLEAGLTRFIALYRKGAPVTVGPVRSIRPVDAALIAPFHPLFVFSGGQDFVRREVEATGARILDESAGSPLFRGEGVPPHNLFLDFQTAVGLATDLPSAFPIYQFDGAAFTGEPAERVRIELGRTEVVYRYQEGSGYVREQNGDPFEVLAPDGTPRPFTRSTVVIQFVAQKSAGYTDVNGAEVPDFDVVGFGNALVFHGGQVASARWRRASTASGTEFVTPTGETFRLPAGTLIVEIVPDGSEVEYR